jgi:hypothetical protein
MLMIHAQGRGEKRREFEIKRGPCATIRTLNFSKARVNGQIVVGGGALVGEVKKELRSMARSRIRNPTVALIQNSAPPGSKLWQNGLVRVGTSGRCVCPAGKPA